MSRIALVAAVLLLSPLAVASHADGTYDIPVWFQWGRTHLDVVIVPPNHGQLYNGNGALGGGDPMEINPLGNSYLRAIEDSVQNWKDAIQLYGPSWLRTRLDIDVYVLGRDVNTNTVNPEVLIVTDENKGTALGLALSGTPCIVDNSKMFLTSFTYEDMFNINAQEFGHCLGLEHVVESHPVQDPMNGLYPYSPGAAGNPLNCVSNLDVKGLEGVFAKAMGQPSSLWGANGRVSVNAYQQSAC